MADTVKLVKEKLSIVDVVSGYVKLERSGQSLRARCPFHGEKTPSFFVSQERGTYHCFGCDVGGDIFSFVQEIEGIDFKGALKMLAERAGVPLVYERGEKAEPKDRLYELLETATIFYQGKLGADARNYLAKRGLQESTIRAFRLGYADDAWSDASDFIRKKGYSEKEVLDAGMGRKNEKGTMTDKFRNRIMFPIADTAGRIVGFSGRSFGEKAHPDAPKYLNSPETELFKKSKILYAFDRAKHAMRKHNFAILVEGQMDLLASHQAGWANTVAVSGTAFTEDHAALVKRMTDNILLALDADEAGIKAAGRAARTALAAGLNVKVAELPDGKDPADLILESGADAWRKVIREGKDIITFLLDVLERHAVKRDQYRRAVESVVLPFLADVQSPIARDQYTREVAERLGVSQRAVEETLSKMPRTNVDATRPHAPEPRHPAQLSRAEQLYALLLYVKEHTVQDLAYDEARRIVQEAVGEEALSTLDARGDIERIRFEGERLFSHQEPTRTALEAAARIAKRERLEDRRRELSDTLRILERSGEEDAQAVVLKQIAEVHAAIAGL